jgi:hypothetical protein
LILFYSKLATPSSIRSFFCHKVASNFYSSWDKCPSNLWTLPNFSELANMSRDNLTFPVAAATPKVKLRPYNEEEPHIWFRLIMAQFAAAGIKSQNSNMPTCPSKSFRAFWQSWAYCAEERKSARFFLLRRNAN